MIYQVSDYQDGPKHEVVTFGAPPRYRDKRGRGYWTMGENRCYHYRKGEYPKEFAIIKRPPIPELDNFVEKYLQYIMNQSPAKTAGLFAHVMV